ncbi:hypothetical protein WME79_22725 [Sorangium sp. So ce726]|uniref:hypothetical protein n=1 Tax=Sorangium sp. So ce726 TaxID=3133319 RepID=UPI003F60EE11
MKKHQRFFGTRKHAAVFVTLALAAGAVASGCNGSDSPEEPTGGTGGTSSSSGTVSGSAGTGGSPSTQGSPCPEPTGAGTVHDTLFIEADETWTAEASPHHVPSSIAIRGATVTVEACAVVVIGEDQTIEIGDSSGEPAALRATGEVDAGTLRPATFTSEGDGSYFGSLWVDVTGALELENTVIVGGGSVNTGTTNGAIVAMGPLGLPANDSVHLVNVTVSDSAGIGVHLGDFTAFSADSDGLAIEGAGAVTPVGSEETLYPLAVTTAALSSIPRGDYVNNARDAVLVDAADRYPADVVLRDRGVPYVSAGDFHLEPDDANALDFTIEAGVTVAFPAESRLALGSASGPVRVVAQGTAAKPIVFTSVKDTKAAGDWVGVDWGGAPAGGNVFDFVRIEYAGAPSQISSFGCGPNANDAALILTGWRPDGAFIENSSFVDSAGGGIVSGWDSDQAGPDLTSNNVFEGLAACSVTQPKVSGACPGADATPDCY